MNLLIKKYRKGFTNLYQKFAFSELTFSPFGGSLYSFVPLQETFEQSNEVCRALDGNIAAPTSDMAREFLLEVCADHAESFWTGMYFAVCMQILSHPIHTRYVYDVL